MGTFLKKMEGKKKEIRAVVATWEKRWSLQNMPPQWKGYCARCLHNLFSWWKEKWLQQLRSRTLFEYRWFHIQHLASAIKRFTRQKVRWDCTWNLLSEWVDNTTELDESIFGVSSKSGNFIHSYASGQLTVNEDTDSIIQRRVTGITAHSLLYL